MFSMKEISEYKEIIHSCSKCGLCQSVCPVYKITRNDCTVSRGQFIMLKGLIKGDLQMTQKLNKYLDLCLKCGACSKFCPSEIDVVEIVAAAKYEYFKRHPLEKFMSFVQNNLIFGLGVKILGVFRKKYAGRKFDKKVIYFGGCGGRIKGNKAVVKILNACGIEVITPDFECCGIPLYVRGDKVSYEKYRESFKKNIEKYGITDIVTTCASCEKTLKGYHIEGLNIKNIFEYIRENNLKFQLKKPEKVTFHKPCNIDNFDDIKWILDNTDNLEYIEMNGFDECCGFNGILKPAEFGVMSKIFRKKHDNIVKTGAKTVLTSCIGCEIALMLFSYGKYKIADFTEFLGRKISS